MSRNIKEMIGGCCVCSDELGWSENPLVYCDGQGCNVAVHQACYGIVQVPTGPWFCKKCESQERIARVKCELCPQRDGALKRTNSGGWCHVVCALYIPEAWFANVQTMEPIVLSSVPHERFNKTCYICEEQKRDTKATAGACMQCNRNGCKQYFHVTCAQAQGLLCEVTGSYENVKYCGYCSHHYKKLKNYSNVKTIPAFRPIPNDNETPDSSPEKNPPAIKEEESKKPTPTVVPEEREVKSPQVDQSVSSTSDSVPPTLVPNNKADSTIPSSSLLRRNLSQVSDISSAASPVPEEMKSPAGSDQGQEPSSSVGGGGVSAGSSSVTPQLTPILPQTPQLTPTLQQTPQLTPILQDASATSSTENLFEMSLKSEPPCLEKEPSMKKSGKKSSAVNTDTGPKRQRMGARTSDKLKLGKGASKKSKSSVTSTLNSGSSSTNRGESGSKKSGGKRTRHQSGSSAKSQNSGPTTTTTTTTAAAASSSNTQTSSLPGHHDYCGSVFGGSPYFQSLSAPGHVNLPSFSSSPVLLPSLSNPRFGGMYGNDYYHPYDPSSLKTPSSNLVPPLKTFSNPFQDSSSKFSFPLTMEQLLEQQWDHGAQFLMDQSDHFDISSLLTCLHRLKSENRQLEDQIGDLTQRRNHLMAVNARLSVPLSLLDSSPLMTRTSSWGSLEDISSPDDVIQTPKFPPASKMSDQLNLGVEDILSPAESSQHSLKGGTGPSSSNSGANFVFSDAMSQPLMYSVVNPPPDTMHLLDGGLEAASASSSLPASSVSSLPLSSSSSSSPSLSSSLPPSSVFKSSFMPFPSLSSSLSSSSSSSNPSMPLLEPSLNSLHLATHLRPPNASLSTLEET